MRSPRVIAFEAFMRKPPGGDPMVRSGIAAADPVPG
jgi:hypothetical protein